MSHDRRWNVIWPLMSLAVVTPVLSLHYVTDDLGVELAELAADGIHDPATMPFSRPWTDVAPPELQRNTLRFYWETRAATRVEHWDIHLAALVDGAVVGMCSVEATGFPATRSAETGSWIGRRHQRRGYGREIRCAALHLIFEGLRGERATTQAWHDNTASLAVTRSLPYVQAGTARAERRGHPDTMLQFAMNRQQWDGLGRDDIGLVGIKAVRTQLGV